jgi:hypothetical protein
MSTVMGIWGEDKSGKSTLALTAPKPVAYFEFDIGGKDRAIWQFEDDVKKGNIILQNKAKVKLAYPHPLPKPSMKQSALAGYKEVWNRFLVDYIEMLENPKIQSIVLDTGTLLWSITTQGFLQEKQEIQIQRGLQPGEKLRERLQQIEYAEPNSRMRSLLYAAKNQGKNLIITHHARDEFKAMPTANGIEELRTGVRELAGWGGFGAIADLILHTEYKKGKEDKVPSMYATVDMSGICLQVVGMSFKDPTYNNLMLAVANMRQLKVTIK